MSFHSPAGTWGATPHRDNRSSRAQDRMPPTSARAFSVPINCGSTIESQRRRELCCIRTRDFVIAGRAPFHIVVAMPVQLRPLANKTEGRLVRQLLATVSDTGAPLAGALVAASLLNPVAMVDA